MKCRCCWFAFAVLCLSPLLIDLTPLAEARWTRTRTLTPAKGADVGACGVAATCSGLAVETRTKTRLVRVRGNDRGACAGARSVCN